MKLKSFQIYNFRSIEDSGLCYLAPDITLLAGKNESGKTNILEALEKLETLEFNNEDKPLHLNTEEQPKIVFNFEMSDAELKKFEENLKVKLVIANKNLTMQIYYEANESEIIDGELVRQIRAHLLDELIKSIPVVKKNLKELYLELEKANINIEKIEIEGVNQKLVEEINKIVNGIPPQLESIDHPETNDKISKIINFLSEYSTKLSESFTKFQEVKKEILSFLPNIVLFNSFDDELPTEILLKDINSDKGKVVRAFCSLSGLDVDKLLKAKGDQERKMIVSQASKVYSDAFGKYWNQDPVNISVESMQKDKLTFFVFDKGKGDTPYKPTQRSKGLRWYLSFFLLLNSQESKRGNIILIDEPGLYLHARAQENVLETLKDLSKENQVIFTTHSPYLIDPNELSRIKLVIKDAVTKKTDIKNNFYAGAGEDTLTPIITAIGLDLTKGLTFGKKNNIVLEGITDYYHLQAMKKYLKEKNSYNFPEDIAFIPCVGHTKIFTIISLLMGFGADFKILIDKKGTKKTHDLLKHEGIEEDKIFFSGVKPEDSLEDLYTKSDFIKYFLKSKTQVKDKENTGLLLEHTKKNKTSKTILTKNFYDQIKNDTKSINFSKKTLENFTNLFEKLKK